MRSQYKPVPVGERKQIRDVELYRQFNNPYTALAAMILYQAVDDLRSFGDKDIIERHGQQVRKYDVVSFLRSSWAEELALHFGIDRELLLNLTKE